jgi:uncharacterized membrane protein
MHSLPSSSEIRASARSSLAGFWGKAVVVGLLFYILNGAVGTVPFGTLLCTGAFTIGYHLFSMGLVRRGDPSVATLFDGFKQFGKTILLFLLITVFTFLWTLLLIVPGIVAHFRYSQAYYILIDNPEISPMEAIRRSKAMMTGYKSKLFTLYLSFIGWYILCLCTAGIGFLWLSPYHMTAKAAFYELLNGNGGGIPAGWIPPTPYQSAPPQAG